LANINNLRSKNNIKTTKPGRRFFEDLRQGTWALGGLREAKSLPLKSGFIYYKNYGKIGLMTHSDINGEGIESRFDLDEFRENPDTYRESFPTADIAPEVNSEKKLFLKRLGNAALVLTAGSLVAGGIYLATKNAKWAVGFGWSAALGIAVAAPFVIKRIRPSQPSQPDKL
jgi:hypothetical protein